jgi:primosomal protein N' (replication factor Y)
MLNRRGYAAFLQCPGVARCRWCDCSIALALRVPPALRCHYCGKRFPVPAKCAACDRAIQRAQDRHPAARRADRGAVSRARRGADGSRYHVDSLESPTDSRAVDRGGGHLLGTQMIAKGLDFPRVTLVGVLDADVALHLPDFRAAERTFQLLVQVAAAGGGPRVGRCWCRRRVGHPALKFAARHDTEGFRRTGGGPEEPDLSARDEPVERCGLSRAGAPGSGQKRSRWRGGWRS